MKVGILGAQGKFGNALAFRLQQVRPESVEILSTVDKLHNKEIAAKCELVILTVQPENTEALLQEIAAVLRPDAQVLSFAAKCSLENLVAITTRPVARGIADPWWKISCFYFGENFSTDGLEFLFEDLTKEKPQIASRESELHNFSILISYVFAILVLQKLDRVQNPPQYLAFASEHMKIPMTTLEGLTPEGDPEALITLMSTKGGITEKIIQTLEVNPEIEPQALFDIAAR